MGEIPCDFYEFAKQEVVLCFHGPQLYKAKILKRTVNKREDGMEEKCLYFVHYHGWNSQWDEWVESQRILKYSEENLERQKAAKLQEGTKNNKNNTKNNNKKKKNRKRQIEDSEESESDTFNGNDQSLDTQNNQHLQSLMDQQRELKKKDLDDLELNQKIKILEKKRQNALNANISNISSTKNRRTSKHRNPSESEQNDDVQRRKQFKAKLETITLQTTLKDHLVQQYLLIHSQKKLIKLPKPIGFRINDILKEVVICHQNKLKEKQQQKINDDEEIKSMQTINEILPFINVGIRGFFKNTLQINLLYNFEKPQFEKFKNEEIDLCDIYGVEHLLRLFYILPNILIHTKGVDLTNFAQIKQCISLITQFITKQKTKYLIDFNQDHLQQHTEEVDNEYFKKVQKIAKKYDHQ